MAHALTACLIRQAEAENRRRDEERAQHRAQVRREVLEAALGRYMYDAGAGKLSVDMEHVDKAAAMLDSLRKGGLL